MTIYSKLVVCMDKLKLLILSHVKLLHLCNSCLHGLLHLFVSIVLVCFEVDTFNMCMNFERFVLNYIIQC